MYMRRLEDNTSYKVCKFCNLSHTIDQDTVEFKDNVVKDEFASSCHLRESQHAFTAVSTSTESSHITEPLAQDIHIESWLREIKSEVKTEIKTEEFIYTDSD
ncbi:PREDICTED: uncharacterized protein LOC105559055 [Vollenhovia emeryi]|uniref:uncharacterized protein LOC105559055 n=1 Tax=Vollenhovia emeryi TaxID=411798 RepID=UPI0005F36270|nr:PREDICTED: uncharacterized protein LOC105559055 [Vollenhovia emeryi]